MFDQDFNDFGSMQDYFSQLPTITVVKDINSRFIALSKLAATFLFGIKNPQQAVGLFDKDIPGKASEFSDIYIKQDKIVIDSGDKILLDVNMWADKKMRAFLTTKQRYYNQSKKVVGTIFNCVELTQQHYSQLTPLLNFDAKKFKDDKNDLSASYEINNHKNLTNREMDCLFYLMRGYTVKMIAEVLCLSTRTVEVYVNKLKGKFNVCNKNELVDKAITNGYMLLITENFLRNPTSIILY